jgi:hypothetical protein
VLSARDDDALEPRSGRLERFEDRINPVNDHFDCSGGDGIQPHAP